MSADRNFYFVLRFMDDENVEHELELDHFQLVFRRGRRQLWISLSDTQSAEISDLPSIQDRTMP